jgi:hypothetical protein
MQQYAQCAIRAVKPMATAASAAAIMAVQVPKAHCAALLLMLAAVTATSVLASLQLTCGTWEVRRSERQCR